MKTKTEKELEREIEKRYKEVRKTYEKYGKANNWEEKNIERATIKELEENDYETAILKAKLEGYRLAKEEFMKKVVADEFVLSDYIFSDPELGIVDWAIEVKYVKEFIRQVANDLRKKQYTFTYDDVMEIIKKRAGTRERWQMSLC